MKLLKKRSVTKALSQKFGRSKSTGQKSKARRSFRKSSKKNVAPPAIIETENVEDKPAAEAVEAEPAEDAMEEKASESHMSVASRPPSPMSVSSDPKPEDEEAPIEDEAATEDEVVPPTEAAAEESTDAVVEEEADAPAEAPTEAAAEESTDAVVEEEADAPAEAPTEAAPEEEIAPPAEEELEEEVVSAPTEALLEEEAAIVTELEPKEIESEEEMESVDDVESLEPSIEMIHKEESVAIGFFMPTEAAPREEAEEDIMSKTLAIGAEIMDQYFSCIPACYDFTAVNNSSELSTGEVKKQVDTPIVKETTHLIPEVDDRNDCLAEENPAADLNEEVRQEIRV